MGIKTAASTISKNLNERLGSWVHAVLAHLKFRTKWSAFYKFWQVPCLQTIFSSLQKAGIMVTVLNSLARDKTERPTPHPQKRGVGWGGWRWWNLARTSWKVAHTCSPNTNLTFYFFVQTVYFFLFAVILNPFLIGWTFVHEHNCEYSTNIVGFLPGWTFTSQI